jgi:enoyl-CoA hydratase/carnithine racemase
MATFQVETAADGAIVIVSFDHGKANEMGTAQLDELDALVARLRGDGPDAGAPGVGTARALITTSRKLTAKGTPIFVSGANVTERVGWDDARVKAHVRRQRATLEALRRAPVFHVTVVHGVAFGWGTEFTLTADYVIAAPGARFALPETGLGILPGAGGTTELQRRVGPAQALRLGMTGEPIGAEEAVRIGLAQELAPDLDAGLARAHELAARAATRSPTACAALKEALLASQGADPARRTALEAAAYERCVDAGEAAIGRAWFAAGGQGTPAWGPRRA